MFVDKKDGQLIFFWNNEMPGVWELNARNQIPYAIVRLSKRSDKSFVVESRLKMGRMKKTKQQPAEYSAKLFCETEQQVDEFVESEKRRVEELLKETWSSDYILKALNPEDAIDFLAKGISTCINCGKKYISQKKYHRYCDACGEKVKIRKRRKMQAQ